MLDQKLKLWKKIWKKFESKMKGSWILKKVKKLKSKKLRVKVKIELNRLIIKLLH